MKVSIVLPTYNGEKWLGESIQSVIDQTFSNWELIIVNDCSTDNTLKIADFDEKGLLTIRGHKLSRYLTYKKLIKGIR